MLNQEEYYEALLEDGTDEFLESEKPTRYSQLRNSRWMVLVSVLFSLLTFLVGLRVGRQWPQDEVETCPKYISRYTSFLDEIDTSYHVQTFNGSLLKANVFRQDAGPEVDAAWSSLGVDYRSVLVSPAQAAKSGIMEDQVHVLPEYGGGYFANVEGLHQLHCLNLIRKALYYNFDYYHSQGGGAFTNSDHVLKYHVSHCVDILRQQLQCSVDTGLLGQVWIQPDPEQAPEAYVDFNTQHKCKNFDSVRQWAEEHQLPQNLIDKGDYLEPPKEGDTVYTILP